jgi:hypothetical protein
MCDFNTSVALQAYSECSDASWESSGDEDKFDGIFNDDEEDDDDEGDDEGDDLTTVEPHYSSNNDLFLSNITSVNEKVPLGERDIGGSGLNVIHRLYIMFLSQVIWSPMAKSIAIRRRMKRWRNILMMNEGRWPKDVWINWSYFTRGREVFV